MQRLNKIQGKVALDSKWFSNLVDRVEGIKPLEGVYIQVKQTSDGQIIGINYDDLKNQLEKDLGGDYFVTEYTLNVCNNGSPSTLIVYGPSGQSA
jgi:hypothetical protein